MAEGLKKCASAESIVPSKNPSAEQLAPSRGTASPSKMGSVEGSKEPAPGENKAAQKSAERHEAGPKVLEATKDAGKKIQKSAEDGTIREKKQKKKENRKSKPELPKPEDVHDVPDILLRAAFSRASERWPQRCEEIFPPSEDPPFNEIEIESTATVYNAPLIPQQTHQKLFRHVPDPWRKYATRRKMHELGGFVLADSGEKVFLKVAKGSQPPPCPNVLPISTDEDYLKRTAKAAPTKPRSRRKRQQKESVNE
ncbi:hypothetical protein L596_009022 [Steinernema carpocapsae]|uniref:Uncharacterized protein n=2 Tax=Steinernema carpocapsae TaxID=34508 RepID=A0A4U5PEC7_STECR|nr:hypothetical protein L596_009022 [Steinernema carpocapsae]